MALTRNFKETVIQRVQSDFSFSQALLDEAATLFLNDEPETARLILRELVNATIGFEQLAALTAKPSKSLHRSPHRRECTTDAGCNAFQRIASSTGAFAKDAGRRAACPTAGQRQNEKANRHVFIHLAQPH